MTKVGTKKNVDHTSKVPGDVNSIYHDGPVTITKNGQTMYFSRNNFTDGFETKDSKGLTNMKIYRATLVDGEWTNIEDLPLNGDAFSTQHAALNIDDSKLYFASDRPGGYGGSDIWVVDIEPDGSLTNMQNIGNTVNTESAEGFPFINNEGVLFFSSDGHTGLGLLDIFATIKGEDEEFVDVVNLAPAKVAPQTFVDALRKITPRLYSIASAQAEVEEEVHLTVGLVNYENNGQQRFGGASHYLANRIDEGQKVRVFVEHNDNFRLPNDTNTPVIMIGPGTGVAPFRAFMQQREADEASGDNWMFFGDQTFTQDFLYQVEWQNYLKSGLLTRMDVAFSRDQAEKIYVQNRILDESESVYQWLESGAHIYICGDMHHMAKDVHQALITVIERHSTRSAEEASEWLDQLIAEKRYQRDVY